ncbi:MAG: phosphoenolpyruvate synthase, partial [Candidatus Kapaibacterium sp.]
MNNQKLPNFSSNDTGAYVLPFSKITMKDVASAGGKNASLGEMTQALTPLGVRIPEGFAITTDAFHDFLAMNNLQSKIETLLQDLDRTSFSNLHAIGENIRNEILRGVLPEAVERAIVTAYRGLAKDGKPVSVAVRSSATSEDLAGASFAGQLESYLNITSDEAVTEAVRKCFASLYTDRAIKYQEDQGLSHNAVAVSVGIQRMVRSDKGASGVAFTLDPDSGFNNVLLITGAWGLGENVVQGMVEPDEFILFKPSLKNGKRAVISHKLGAKEKMMVYGDGKDNARTKNLDTPTELRERFVLNDLQIEELGDWLLAIEEHYKAPMDVEWALDGITNELWIVQARPETVQSREKHITVSEYELNEEGIVLSHGMGLGNKIVTGQARILASPREEDKLVDGEILVTDITSPDWDPVMKRAHAIITNKGGRTSHAAIVARELGTPAIVGALDATEKITNGEMITVVCDSAGRGTIYRGALRFSRKDRDLSKITMPRTKPMLILADPDRAFELSFYPNKGVGLLRIEFIITDSVRIHPMALVNYDVLKDASARQQIAKLTKGYT